MYLLFEQLLNEKGVRASDVCKATGIAPSTLTDWKTGRSTPKYDKLKKIADYFGVTVDYLKSGEDSTQADKASNELWDIMRDAALLSVLKKYNRLSPEKKKLIIDTINLLTSE